MNEGGNIVGEFAFTLAYRIANRPLVSVPRKTACGTSTSTYSDVRR